MLCCGSHYIIGTVSLLVKNPLAATQTQVRLIDARGASNLNLSHCWGFFLFLLKTTFQLYDWTTEICRLLLYLAVCVSFVSPYLFITPTPKFCPFGLRMRGGPPLLDYGIKVSVLTRNDAPQSRVLPHQMSFSYAPLSVIRVPCRQAVLNRCMHSTGYVIT